MNDDVNIQNNLTKKKFFIFYYLQLYKKVFSKALIKFLK